MTDTIGVSQVSDLETLASKEPKILPFHVEAKTTNSQFLEALIVQYDKQNSISSSNKLIKYSLFGAAASVLFVPIEPIVTMSGVTTGLILAYLFHIHKFMAESALHDMESNREKARQLDNQNFILVKELGEADVLPMHVMAAQYIFSPNLFPSFPVYTVKLQNPDIFSVQISDLSQYVCKPVMVSGFLSSSPGAEDMKISIPVNLGMRGSIGGLLPFGGMITGNLDGRLYSPGIQFRITDKKDTSMQVDVDYFNEDDENEIIPPYMLKHSNPKFGGSIQFARRNDLVHFLRDAQTQGTEISLLGKADRGGVFHAEAIGNLMTREVYFLAVHQPYGKLLPSRTPELPS